MVTSNTAPGLLTTLNTGAYNATGGSGERVLIDYKDAILDYQVTSLPVLAMFTEPMTTDTGGDIDITFAKPSMGMEQINEGNTPKYQHTNLRSERVTVREWGIAVGVTRRMIEDSRFNEVEMALNEARRAVDRHLEKHVVYALMGIADTNFETIAITAATTEATIVNFATNIYGGFIGTGGTLDAGRIYSYGLSDPADLIASHYVDDTGAAGVSGSFAFADVTNAMNLIAAHGYTADTLFISPKHYATLLNIGDFVTAFTVDQGGEVGDASNPTTAAMLGGSPVKDASSTGRVGSIYGLNVVMNAWCPTDRYLVYDSKVKPMVYVERRPLTVEEANPGFGIVGSYMSMRYGLKVVRPETGVVIINV